MRAESAEKSGELIKDLEHYVTLRDDETDESPFEKIVVSWPIEMLQVNYLFLEIILVQNFTLVSQVCSLHMLT